MWFSSTSLTLPIPSAITFATTPFSRAASVCNHKQQNTLTQKLSKFIEQVQLNTGCGDIAYCLMGYFILSHPVISVASLCFHLIYR